MICAAEGMREKINSLLESSGWLKTLTDKAFSHFETGAKSTPAVNSRG
jgi:hypothetical protein